jgi:5-methylcytosine-specific restriction endonuclease McrA
MWATAPRPAQGYAGGTSFHSSPFHPSPGLAWCPVRATSVTFGHHNARKNQKGKKAGLKSAHWRQVRGARLQLDNYRCTFQLDRCTGAAEAVHLAPELGGNHLLATIDTTRSCCRVCHGIVDGARSHSRTGGSRGRRDHPNDRAVSVSLPDEPDEPLSH